MSTLQQLNKIDLAIDKYIRKLSRRNEPLENYRTQREYKAFNTQFKTAISKQMTDIADALNNTNDKRLTGPDSLAYTKNFLMANFVPIRNYVDKGYVVKYYKGVYNYTVKTAYQRNGVIAKGAVTFNITNQNILAKLADQANSLLDLSSIDQTTQDQLWGIISTGIEDGLTPYEIADTIQANIDGISDYRANMITDTETANIMGSANLDFMTNNGVEYKQWVTAGNGPCDDCQSNEDAGEIPVDDSFPTGDDSEPAHPNCECYVDAVQSDLSDVPDSELWSGN